MRYLGCSYAQLMELPSWYEDVVVDQIKKLAKKR